MYQCIGVAKSGWFRASSKGCGQKWHDDTDRCPKCNGYLIPESMVNDHHRENMNSNANIAKGDGKTNNYLDSIESNAQWHQTFEPCNLDLIRTLKQLQYDYELSEDDESMKKVITWLLKAQK